MKKMIAVLFLLVFPSSASADYKMDLGLDVYNNKAQCGVCHTLKAVGSTGDIGPNLDQLRPTISRIISVVASNVIVEPESISAIIGVVRVTTVEDALIPDVTALPVPNAV